MKYLTIIILSLVAFLVPSTAAHSSAAMEHPRNARLKLLMQQWKSGQIVVTPARPVRIAPVERPQAKPQAHRRKRPMEGCQVTKVAPAYAIVEREAVRAGISPVVVYAIQVHESGNYRSRLWRYANNPGGIEYRAFGDIKCWRHNGGRWAAFATPEDGIRAHVAVLAHHRYRRARETSDPLQQVEYIGRAGYCEPGYSSTAKVKV